MLCFFLRKQNFVCIWIDIFHHCLATRTNLITIKSDLVTECKLPIDLENPLLILNFNHLLCEIVLKNGCKKEIYL